MDHETVPGDPPPQQTAHASAPGTAPAGPTSVPVGGVPTPDSAALGADAARSPTPATETPAMTVEVLSWPTVTYAYAHNRVPVVRELRIATSDVGPQGLLRIDVDMRWSREAKPPAKAVSFTVDAPEPGGEPITIRDVGLKLDDTVLIDLEESVPATVQVRVRGSGDFEATVEHELRVLARNEWTAIPSYLDALAAYVQPNHPVTKDVLAKAKEILKERTGSASTEGYQSGPDRAIEIGRAVFEALQSFGITYSNPPASFETNQKIRPLDEVLEQKVGTCLDLACAYASCLEQAGLKPLIWVVPGHAFAGFLTTEAELPESVVTDPGVILMLHESDLTRPVETVGLTDGTSFDVAVDKAAARFDVPSFEGPLSGLVDVHRAHRAGTLPLPARVVRGEVVTVVVDPGPGRVPVVERREKRTGRLLADEVPPRIKRWQASLLDLSLRNPLLNFSTERRGLDVLVPPKGLGRIEDDLQAGVPIAVHPGDKIEGPAKAAGIRTITNVTGEALREFYDGLHLLYSPSGQEEGARRMRWLASRAKLVEGETGANNLYLALGTLHWKVGTKPVTSPLYLVPVRMRRPKGASLVGLVADENGFTTPNYCLAEKLKAEYSLDIPEYEIPEEDESGIDIERGLKAVRKALLDRGLNFRVDETAHLAILQFSTFRLWKDMSDHWSTFLENPVVRHMVEKPGQKFVDPAAADDPVDQVDLHEAEVLAPVPIDGSQLRSVARAAAGHSFVLEGPPGTGKSQTITNLLAHALATGKTVLFVAEKQAALSVVKDRIASVGLDPYCLDLHDKGSPPSEIRSQLLHALDYRPEADVAKHDETSRSLKAVHDRLEGYKRALYEANGFDHSYATVHRRLLELGDGPSAEVPRTFLDRQAKVAERVETVLLEAAPAIQAARPGPRHAWRFVTIDAFDAIDRPALAKGLQALAEAHERLGNDTGAAQDVLRNAVSPEDLEDAALLVSAKAKGNVPAAADLERLVEAEWTPAFAKALDAAEKAVEEAKEIFASYGTRPFERPLRETRDAHEALVQASRSFFLVRGRRVRAAMSRLLAREDVPRLKAQEAVALGARLERRHEALEKARGAIEAVGAVDLADFRIEQEGAIDRLRSAGERRLRIARLLARTDASGLSARRLADTNEALPPGLASKIAAVASTSKHVLRMLDAPTEAFARWLGGRGILEAFDEALPKWLEDAEDERFLSLQRWIQLFASLEPLRSTGLDRLADAVLDGEVPANDVDVVFRRGLFRASLRERSETNRLDTFDSVAHEQILDRYLRLTEARRSQLQDVIPVMLSGSRSFNPASGYGAVAELRVELQKKRGAKSVRNLVARFPKLIQQLTPCFLMSPDSVAKFLPAGEILFDMVVFDEASQIDLAEAIGAMGRARSVVIVGDSKQMPPTRFAVADGGADDVFEPEEDDGVLPEDGESLLVEAVETTGLDREWLSWHYRSRDESLIAFSNRHYYEDRLASFPTPRTDGASALRWVKVEGQYDHGKRRINEAEAEAVVAEIVRRVNDPAREDETIGVITLNTQQQTEITRRIEASGDARAVELLASEDDDGIFVRNLESVQGHERDVILFSTAFSKKADGSRMPLNFGPLNREGGERRLNVAVTRARQEVIIFSSFEPEEIEVERTSARGLLHLREYLKMAKYGVRADHGDQDELARDVHRDDVRAALEARGLRVSSDVGLSPFRVDLAVSRPGTDRWHVAVLLDGPRWERRSTVGDRDGLPVAVLQNLMGWPRVARVWLPSWQVERQAVIERIEKLVDEAMKLGEAREDAPKLAAAIPTRPALDRAPAPAAFMGAAGVAPPTKVDPWEGLVRFEPYPDGPPLGTQDDWTLDVVREPARRALAEAVEHEGPVEARRLAKLVAGRFGIGRLHKSRAKTLLSLLPRQRIRSGPFGTFVWPAGHDPETYGGFRISPDDAVRAVDEIAPRELVNAMRHVAREAHTIEPVELVRAVAALFGVRRITQNIESHLTKVMAHGIDGGHLVEVDGAIRVSEEGSGS